MASERRTRVEHLIVDANAFIRNVNLLEIGEKIYTLKNVVEEIRDKATRQRLQVLPYKLNFRVPTTESIRAVTDFSKKTGDYPSLSATDLSILGLTYFLENEVHGGVNHLNAEPKQNFPLVNPERKNGEVTLIGGVAVPVISDCIERKALDSDEHIESTDNKSENEINEDAILKRLKNVNVIDENDSENESEEEEQSSEEENENSDEGWITVDNIKNIKRTMGLGDMTTEEQNMPRVACMTADFAMQNVLIQMGLKCLSMDGMCIRRARTYILRCFACFQRTSDMTRIFCKSCGNKGTLKKVAVEVDDQTGELKMFINYKKQINQRGLRYHIPHFKGGKHANNPILNEYQPRPQNKLPKKALQKLNALDPDFCAQENPFGKNDVQSRAAMLGVRHIRGLTPGLDRDPYMNRVRTGNKKRKNRRV